MKEIEEVIRKAEKMIREALEKHADELPKECWASLNVYNYYASYFSVCDKNGIEDPPITLSEGWINENDEEVSETA